MDLAISSFMLVIIGLGLALFAIIVALQIALKAKKEKKCIPDGLYRMRKVGEDGLDSIFEIEEVSSSKDIEEIKEDSGGPKEKVRPRGRRNKKA